VPHTRGGGGCGCTVRDSHPASEPSMAAVGAGVTAALPPLAAASSSHTCGIDVTHMVWMWIRRMDGLWWLCLVPGGSKRPSGGVWVSPRARRVEGGIYS